MKKFLKIQVTPTGEDPRWEYIGIENVFSVQQVSQVAASILISQTANLSWSSINLIFSTAGNLFWVNDAIVKAIEQSYSQSASNPVTELVVRKPDGTLIPITNITVSV
jgi:hypothetical protein